MARLTEQQRDAILRMQDGWTPLAIQASFFQSLERRGLVRFDLDDKNRLVVKLTDAGRAAVKS